MVLYAEGYLKDRAILHCPRDRTHDDANQAAFFQSYTGREADDTATAKQVKITYLNDQDSGDSWNNSALAINRYRYLPCRIFKPFRPPARRSRLQLSEPARAELDQRQHQAADEAGHDQRHPYWTPVQDRNWWPDDRTIVSWCPFHADLYSKDGVGQYLVLFWDGSAVMKAAHALRAGHRHSPAALRGLGGGPND